MGKLAIRAQTPRHCMISRTDTDDHQCAGRTRPTDILVDELHWQTARWLTGNYKVILLPTFETQDIMMLSFRHYEFKRRLRWKAWQRGALVIEVNEAYTRTRSWDGASSPTCVIRDESGFGKRRPCLRALGSPFLRGSRRFIATNSDIVAYRLGALSVG